MAEKKKKFSKFFKKNAWWWIIVANILFLGTLLYLGSVSAKLTSTSNQINCLDITGGSDSDFCVDTSGNGTGGGGNTTEEIQDAVGSGFTGNLSYNDAGNSYDVNGANILTWLNGFYRRLVVLITGSDITLNTLNSSHIIDGTLVDNDLNLTNITLNDFTNDINIGNWTADKSLYLLISNWNATNSSYLEIKNWNATNTSYATLTVLNNGSYFNPDLTNYIQQSQLNNGTYFLTANWNATNSSYRLNSNLSFFGGDANFTGTIFTSGNRNLTISYYLTTNNTFAQLTTLNNGTYIINSVLNNGSYFNVANGQTKVNNKTCSGTDKFSAYDNVTGNFVCTTDVTGSGSGVSFNVWNRTYANVTTSSATAYTLLYTVPMSANKNVTIMCDILQWANAATVGVQYTFNFTGTGIRAYHLSGTYYTSATAEAIIPYSEKSNGGNSVVLSPITSAGTVASPTRLQGWVSTNGSDAQFLVRFRSETATLTGIMKGSYCRTVEE